MSSSRSTRLHFSADAPSPSSEPSSDIGTGTRTGGTSRPGKRKKKEISSRPLRKAAHSRFSLDLLDPIKKRRGISNDFEFLIPLSDQTATDPPPGYLTFFYHQFEGGLTFPVHHFMCNIANFYNIPLNLLHPTAFKFMSCFYIICEVLGYPPSCEFFLACFLVKAYEGSYHLPGRQGHTFLTGYAPKIRDWKAHFVYVKPPSNSSWGFPHGPGSFNLNRSEPEPEYVSLREALVVRLPMDHAFHVEQILGNSDLVVSTGLWTVPGSKTIADRGTMF